MASSPITVNRWEINGNRLFSWAPKSLQMMTAAMKLKDTCSLEEVQFSSVAQSCPTLLPHGLQHAGLPCLSPTPGAYSNSCPSSQWCHSTISSSAIPFSSCFQLYPSIRVFSNECFLHIRWPKYWSFSFSISPSNEYSGLLSFSIDY